MGEGWRCDIVELYIYCTLLFVIIMETLTLVWVGVGGCGCELIYC